MKKGEMNNYERTDYAELAKEFGCIFRIGTYGVKFFSRNPSGKIYTFISIIPLTGWITEPQEVARIMHARGLEL